ncbi:TOM1-like protein 2 isoform X2 [Arctopsyche grandis]|uniref:TOM1-like protein 2 isoform X2 n=1 Tax=Arctopsyche grandis TaxID=121162 RepID=UPI00406D77C4
MSFFNVGALAGNPFATTVGHKIEEATDGSLPSENWALNMEICDYINDSTEGPKDAIKAIKKRLVQSAGKNYTIVMYTLTVLETCVKNCGKPFHILVCNKEFIQELVKLIGPKNDPPTIVQEKVLSLIQCWADAFQNQPDLSGVVTVYQDLRSKGIEFPMTDLDTMAPIYTPQRSVPEEQIDRSSVVIPPSAALTTVDGIAASPQRVPASPQPLVAAQTPPTSMVNLSSNQISKLQSDLNVVQGNMTVMAEMLNEMTSIKHNQHHTSDLDLLNELHTTLQAMQSRLVDLIGKISDDTLTGELLRVNDELNGLLLRYQRFAKNRGAATGTPAPSAVLAAAMGAPPAESKTADDSLIDLSDEPPSLASLSIGGNDKKPANPTSSDRDEFDMFAQSRNLTYENSKNGSSSYADNLEPEHANVGLVTLAQSRPTTGLPQASGGLLDPHAAQESVTSSDFDKFLAERAAAAEGTPSATANTTQGSRPKNMKDDSSMFAL